MNIKLNLLADFLVNAVSEDSAPHFRSQYDKLIAERNTSDVWRQFALWLLIDPDHGVIRFTKPDSKQHAAIQRVARLYDENCKDRELWEYAYDAAYDAAEAAEAAADAAVEAAYEAAKAAAAAWDAAYYARAARAARAAARAAAWSAEAAAWSAEADAWAAAFAEAHKHMADKLLKLLQLAPPKETP